MAKEKMPQNDEQATVYSKDELIAAAKAVFMTKPEIMAGALHGVNELLTKEAAVAKLAEFLERPIQN